MLGPTRDGKYYSLLIAKTNDTIGIIKNNNAIIVILFKNQFNAPTIIRIKTENK
jgi:hypothetical protein